MFGVIGRATARHALAVGTGLATIGLGIAVLAPVQAVAQDNHEITVSITQFKALDRADDLSNGDFFARVTIDGVAQTTAQISDKAEVHPDWKLSKSVPAGTHKVKLELIDKDVSVDDPIDINKLDKKRDLDFAVDTRTGKIEGFSRTYKSGETITRAGGEKKKASISFVVTVK
jgi:hypothetical protein